MNLTQYSNLHDFLEKTRSFLEKNEAFNNLILGSAFGLARRNNAKEIEECLMFVIEDKEKVVYAALHMTPRNLILSAQEGYLQSGNTLLIAYLQKNNISISGVVGSKTVCMDFVEKWFKNDSFTYRIIGNMGVFQLDEVNVIIHPKGNFRSARKEEEDLATELILSFDREFFAQKTPESARKSAKDKLNKELLYFWEVEGEVVSMAAGIRPTNHCMTISSVYTPPKHRKNGYARSCVAKLSQKMLDKGYHFCALFTDLENPTSNKIYQEVGYRQLGEFVNLGFE